MCARLIASLSKFATRCRTLTFFVSEQKLLSPKKSEYLALDQANPLELVLLALTGRLKNDEVAILGEEVGRFKKFVPRGLGVKEGES